MPPQRDRAAYMREYRRKHKARPAPNAAQLAALESPDADWRRMHPTAALVELARAFPGEPPMDGDDTIPPRPGALTAEDARWRSAAPWSAYLSLSANIAATLTPG